MFALTCAVCGRRGLVGTRAIAALRRDAEGLLLGLRCPCGAVHDVRAGRGPASERSPRNVDRGRPAADDPGMHLSIRLAVVVLLALVVAGLLWDAWRGTPRPLAIGALALVACVLGALEYRAQAAEQRLSAVASAIAERPVSVRCEGFFGELVDIGPHLGTVRFDAQGNPGDRTDLVGEACRDLKAYLGGDREPRTDTATAVHVLAHEAVHLRGVRNEAVTECTSVQLTAETARRLGASREEAQALAMLYWEEVYPLLPRSYRSPECRDGGRLDLNPDSPAWP